MLTVFLRKKGRPFNEWMMLPLWLQASSHLGEKKLFFFFGRERDISFIMQSIRVYLSIYHIDRQTDGQTGQTDGHTHILSYIHMYTCIDTWSLLWVCYEVSSLLREYIAKKLTSARHLNRRIMHERVSKSKVAVMPQSHPCRCRHQAWPSQISISSLQDYILHIWQLQKSLLFPNPQVIVPWKNIYLTALEKKKKSSRNM